MAPVWAGFAAWFTDEEIWAALTVFFFPGLCFCRIDNQPPGCVEAPSDPWSAPDLPFEDPMIVGGKENIRIATN